MAIRFNDAGIVFGPDEINTAHGQIIAELWEQLMRAKRDVEWWQKAALGDLWLEAIDEDEEEPF